MELEIGIGLVERRKFKGCGQALIFLYGLEDDMLGYIVGGAFSPNFRFCVPIKWCELMILSCWRFQAAPLLLLF